MDTQNNNLHISQYLKTTVGFPHLDDVWILKILNLTDA